MPSQEGDRSVRDLSGQMEAMEVSSYFDVHPD